MSEYDNAAQLPSTYDTGPTQADSVLDMGFIKSLPGILQISQIVLCMILFICASVYPEFVWHFGGGWVQFCSMSAFIFSIIIFVLYVFGIVHKLPHKVPRPLIELIYYSVYTLFFFICGIVSAVFGNRHSSIGASAFFSFACMVVFGVDIYFKFQTWRIVPPPQQSAGPTPSSAEAGRPTTTNVDKMQY